MPLTPEQRSIVESFMKRADFGQGGVFLDLDGTALLEDQGKVFVSSSVEKGIREVMRLGRPVVINTLRFPLSIMRTVAEEWLSITTARIPCIVLNGSLIGHIARTGEGELSFEEVAAFPLEATEMDEIVKGISELLVNDIRDLVFFYYPRDWREGEIVWTPNESHVESLRSKYRFSASQVVSWPVDELRRRVMQTEICMAHLFMDRARDTLMAYQHNEPSSFFTRVGIDKAMGTREYAAHFDISLADSVGAGDTHMDRFLSEMGLAVIVGGQELPFHGVRETVAVGSPGELGEIMVDIAMLLGAHTSQLPS